MKVKLSKFLTWRPQPGASPVKKTAARRDRAGDSSDRRQAARVPVRGEAEIYWLQDGRPVAGRGHCVDGNDAGGLGLIVPARLGVRGYVWMVTDEGLALPLLIKHSLPEGETQRLGGVIAEPFETESVNKPGWTADWSWISDTEMMLTESASLRNIDKGRVELRSSRTPPCPSLVLISGTGYCSIASTVETRLQQDHPVTVVEILDTFQRASKAA